MLIPVLITFTPTIGDMSNTISWESSQVPITVYATPFYEGCTGIDVQIATEDGTGPCYTEILPWSPQESVKEYFLNKPTKEQDLYFKYYCNHMQRELPKILLRWYNDVWGINQPKKIEKPPEIDAATSQLTLIRGSLDELQLKLHSIEEKLRAL